MTIPKELEGFLSIDPETMSGEMCFVGTRIPIYILLDNISAGVPMAEFFENYPDLTRKQVQAVMDWQRKTAFEALGISLLGHP